MNIILKKDVSNKHLIIQQEGEVEVDSFQVKMLLSNPVNGLLKCTVNFVDEAILFYYEVTGRQSICSLYEGNRQVNFSELSTYMEDIIGVLTRLDEILLDGKGLVLQPEYIYVNKEGHLQFLYYPGYGVEVEKNLQVFLEYILPKLEGKDELATNTGYDLYQKVIDENFQIDHLKACLGAAYAAKVPVVLELFQQGVQEEALSEETLERIPNGNLAELFRREEPRLQSFQVVKCLLIVILLGVLWISWFFKLKSYLSIPVIGVVSFSIVVLVGYGFLIRIMVRIGQRNHRISLSFMGMKNKLRSKRIKQ